MWILEICQIAKLLKQIDVFCYFIVSTLNDKRSQLTQLKNGLELQAINKK